VTPTPVAQSLPNSPILLPPKPYLVLRDTLCSCEAYGMIPMYKEKKGRQSTYQVPVASQLEAILAPRPPQHPPPRESPVPYGRLAASGAACPAQWGRLKGKQKLGITKTNHMHVIRWCTVKLR
jgi:hypothetical protein